jgi:AraC family transcriptional regulator of adaptative response / DNA-3-methyladenine glycosylase II
MEWLTGKSYGRTFCWPLDNNERSGWFNVQPESDNSMRLSLYWPYPDGLPAVVAHIRRLLDLDADLRTIEQQLQPLFGDKLQSGIRIPGLWSVWEAAVRAVLGQQVSVAGARTQLNRLVQTLGSELPDDATKKLFPTPQQLLDSDLQMIKVPQARRDTLWALAQAVVDNPSAEPESWLALKGIGPWTVAYSKMRGLSDTDIWLAGDLGIQKALAERAEPVDPASLSPWRSYATLQLWFGLAPAAKTAKASDTTSIADSKVAKRSTSRSKQ